MSITASDARRIEKEIDDAFALNPLTALPFPQCVWTLLSVVEDHHYKIKVAQPLDKVRAAMYVDSLINHLTHPLRVCHKQTPGGPAYIRRKLNNEHYKYAQNWLSAAKDYTQFCTIFQLYHKEKIDLRLNGAEIVPTGDFTADCAYEAYDRINTKRRPSVNPEPNLTKLVPTICSATRIDGNRFSVDFGSNLLTPIMKEFESLVANRYVLPQEWEFEHFSLHQFRKLFTCLQAISYAWFVARHHAIEAGAKSLAYSSAVWTPYENSLLEILLKNTGLKEPIVRKIVEYLTFGKLGIREPDIALQPLINLRNQRLAISPFIFLNVDAERNLCVLLNQINSEKKQYSRLVDQKEEKVRSEIIESLSGLGFDFWFGKIANTDIDIAIIDREAKVCLCIEIKWCIEPAEIREVVSRNEDIEKGVKQASNMAQAFACSDRILFSRLSIDESFDFLAIVGSVNFIGRHPIENKNVPVVRIWHLISEIVKRRSLSEGVEWLRGKKYLPLKGKDFDVKEFSIKVGNWTSQWYGIVDIGI